MLKCEDAVRGALTTRYQEFEGFRFSLGAEQRKRRRPAILPEILALPLLAALFAVRPLGGQERKASAQEFNLVLAGDSMITQPISVRKDEPRIMAVVDAVRQGDAAFTNLELTFAGREAPPDELGGNRGAGGTWMASDPSMLKELQWMGFNLFNVANNHSLDYGIQGLRDTIRVLNEGGATYAGIGENLGLARAPGYLATRRGRVALVSCASTITPGAAAGQSRPDARGRPGLNPLRFQTRYSVDAATLEALRKIKAEFKLPGGSPGASGSSETVTLRIGESDATFAVGDKPGVVTTLDPRDLAGLLHSIRDAREMADYVVTYIHAHEAAPAGREVPAQFLVEFAHAAVDAGADVFVASGPHVLRGIEIYKGKVIFYSLANFIYQYDLVRFLPADLYENLGLGPEALPSEADDARSDHDRRGIPVDPLLWQSVIARVVFRDGRPATIILTPISLGFGKKRTERGYPELADAALATQILERLQKLSQPFGTEIAIKDRIGTITIKAGSGFGNQPRAVEATQ
jgi:poly-gamma-glutamate capsule biosynthesis protein CapA/YwtB (metallophosphatase superfamily)